VCIGWSTVLVGQTFWSNKRFCRTNFVVEQTFWSDKTSLWANNCRTNAGRTNVVRTFVGRKKFVPPFFLLRTLLVITYLILFQIGNSFVSKSGIFLALLPSNEFPSFNQHRKEQQKILTLRQNCFETFLKTTIQCFLDCVLWPYH
jgi:hypothetical protein